MGENAQLKNQIRICTHVDQQHTAAPLALTDLSVAPGVQQLVAAVAFEAQFVPVLPQ